MINMYRISSKKSVSHSALHEVPPHPSVIAQLRVKFNELKKDKLLPQSFTFEQYYSYWRAERRGPNVPGLDDGVVVTEDTDMDGPQRITPPAKKLDNGIVVRTMTLLVDFPDQMASSRWNSNHYRQMLFGEEKAYPSGSMREYYRTVSGYDATGAQSRGIDVDGEVYGWFRMPHPLSYYANGTSGFSKTFPNNGQGLARDAVQAALNAGVKFEGFDVLGEGFVTALFIVHAGQGAEVTKSKGDIWSHKWGIPGGIEVDKRTSLKVMTYLTVPEDCQVGVCAHEWGHLAARWADFYDTTLDDTKRSNGLGDYCLMASGSWGGNGSTPTLPNGMLRMFHNWVNVVDITQSSSNVQLKPAAESGGGLLRIKNNRVMNSNQYILVEYRRRRGLDHALPDEGIAVYVVDESIEDVNDENHLAIELMQADNKNHLAKVRGGNQGDANDLYPFLENNTIGKDTKPSLDLPTKPGSKQSKKWSGVTITVNGVPGADSMSVDIKIE
ncbi:MAG: peptidase, M6 (immune inhibitor A) family [Magnetococcales bacterium]|nr:peptidase, M6 (immune inhibitor A) family [Magnetococcales bacterium]